MDTKEFTDLHIHTIFSYDGRNAMEDYVVAAIARGDKRIGFSEHYDYDCVLCGTGQNTPPCNVEEYKDELLRLTEKYGESIEILFGAEFGYDKRATERYGELVEKYRFDYVINSVHLYNGTDFYLLQACYHTKNFNDTVGHFHKVHILINHIQLANLALCPF